MKQNIGKYFFIIITILLVICAVYLFYKNNSKREDIDTSEEVSNSPTEYIANLNLAISGYDTINPLITKNKQVIKISKLIFEPLIDIDENYKIKMCLAKECAKISDTCYLIKLDEQIKWQDGIQISSKDVKFTIEQLKNIESIYSSQVQEIQNVEIIDNSTIKLNLSKGIDFFEYYLSFPILPNHIYENKNFTTNSIIPLGTGMYKIKTIDSKAIVLEKNELWKEKNEKNSKIETILISLYNNMGDVYSNFKIGNVDIISTSDNAYQEYIGNIGYNVKEYKGREYDFISLNCKNNILNEKEVRKAISYAINKTKIISNIFDNKCYVAEFPLDYGNYLHTKDMPSKEYNIEQAKKILKDAGWIYQNNKWQKKNEKGKITTLSFNITVQSDNEARIKVAENIKEQLEELGVEINIKKVADSVYTKCLQNKDYDIILTGINNGFSPDLDYFYGQDNLAQYENDDVTSLINEIKKVTDSNILLTKYTKLIEIIESDSPYIGLYRNKETVILDKSISGEINPNNYNIFNRVWTWYIQK